MTRSELLQVQGVKAAGGFYQLVQGNTWELIFGGRPEMAIKTSVNPNSFKAVFEAICCSFQGYNM